MVLVLFFLNVGISRLLCVKVFFYSNNINLNEVVYLFWVMVFFRLILKVGDGLVSVGFVYWI